MDDAETVGGMATYTVHYSPCPTLSGCNLISIASRVSIFHTGDYSFTVTSLFLRPALSSVLFILRWLVESISESTLIIAEYSEAW